MDEADPVDSPVICDDDDGGGVSKIFRRDPCLVILAGGPVWPRAETAPAARSYSVGNCPLLPFDDFERVESAMASEPNRSLRSVLPRLSFAGGTNEGGSSLSGSGRVRWPGIPPCGGCAPKYPDCG